MVAVTVDWGWIAPIAVLWLLAIVGIVLVGHRLDEHLRQQEERRPAAPIVPLDLSRARRRAHRRAAR